MARASKAVSDQCSALAFYGIRPSPRAAEGFYHAMVEWFGRLGHPPDKGGVTAPGFGTQLGSFQRMDAKLAKKGFRKVTGISLVATTPRAKDWSHDYHVAASYMGDDDELMADIAVRSWLATLTATSLLPVARELVQLLKPVYGIGYTRAHDRYPEYYSIGMHVDWGDLTPQDEAEQELIGTWGETLFEDQVYRKGILRDVYPWNFLTRPHLKKKIGGIPLEQWIRKNTRRGKLSEFGGGMHLWEVPVKHVAAVRRTLLGADLILEPQEDDYDEEDTKLTPEESLAFVFRHFGVSPEDMIVFGGTGKEVPTEEAKQIVKRGRKKLREREK